MTADEPLAWLRVGEAIVDAADGAVWVAGQRVQLSPRLAAALGRLASVAHDSGDLAAASAAYAQALATARRAGATLDVARLLARRARTAADAGDLAGARTALAEARETLPGTGNSSTLRTLDLESGFLALADGRPEVYARRGEAERARKVLAETVRRARQHGLPLAAHRAETFLASL